MIHLCYALLCFDSICPWLKGNRLPNEPNLAHLSAIITKRKSRSLVERFTNSIHKTLSFCRIKLYLIFKVQCYCSSSSLSLVSFSTRINALATSLFALWFTRWRIYVNGKYKHFFNRQLLLIRLIYKDTESADQVWNYKIGARCSTHTHTRTHTHAHISLFNCHERKKERTAGFRQLYD